MAKVLKRDEDPEEDEPETPNNGNGHNGDVNSYLEQMAAYQDAIATLKEEVETLKNDHATGQAKLKLVNLTFDTPDDRMSELTNIPRNLIFRLMYQIELEAMIDPKRNPLVIPLSRIRRMAFFKMMRSVGGQHLIRAGMLAENELRVQEGEQGEPEGW